MNTPAATPASVLVRRETGIGKVTLIEDFPSSGASPFRDGEFEIAESREMMVLETTARAYEEVVLFKSVVVRTEAVGAVLRREQAQVEVEGDIAVRPAPVRAGS